MKVRTLWEWRPERARWQIMLDRLWSSWTFGVDVEHDDWSGAVTVKVPCLWLRVDWWKR